MRILRIMHIDDSEDDALLLSRALRHCEYPTTFSWFPSASDAVNHMEHASDEQVPDVIFCDLRMPGMGGHDFIRWLRASHFPTVPVVVLSSSDRLDDIRTAYHLGANSFLTKPLVIPEICEMIHDMQKRSRRNPASATQCG